MEVSSFPQDSYGSLQENSSQEPLREVYLGSQNGCCVSRSMLLKCLGDDAQVSIRRAYDDQTGKHHISRPIPRLNCKQSSPCGFGIGQHITPIRTLKQQVKRRVLYDSLICNKLSTK